VIATLRMSLTAKKVRQEDKVRQEGPPRTVAKKTTHKKTIRRNACFRNIAMKIKTSHAFFNAASATIKFAYAPHTHHTHITRR
jgi:hypothetical protein